MAVKTLELNGPVIDVVMEMYQLQLQRNTQRRTLLVSDDEPSGKETYVKDTL